jgi:FkbM family methyltransferase
MIHACGAEEMLVALEESGVSGSLVHWERLLVISYATLVERQSNIIDVGGKKGRHVAVFLDHLRANRVYVFEPNPEMVAILRRRCAKRWRNVTIVEMALADHTGAEEFIVNVGAPGESGLRQRAFSNPDRARTKRISVAVGRLDDQVFNVPIHFVKIDVEGGEIGVLRGGRDFLLQHRPILSVEYGRPSYSAYGHNTDTLYEEAALIGYSVCDLFGNLFRSINEWRACVDRLYWDYLLIPQERLEEFAVARAEIGRKATAELGRQARLLKLARCLPVLTTRIKPNSGVDTTVHFRKVRSSRPANQPACASK